MLSQVIQTTQQLADQIMNGPGDSTATGQTKTDVADFRTSLLPQIGTIQQQLIAFANNQQTAVASAKALLNTPQQQAGLRQFITQAQGQSNSLRAQMSGIQDAVMGTRDRFTSDCAALIAEQSSLMGQQQELQGQIAAQQELFRKTQKHIDAINKMSIFLPIAKLADELASLISQKKTSEQQLADFSNRLSVLQNQMAGLVQNTTTLQNLQPLVEQIANSTQGLFNTLCLIDDKLKDQLQGIDTASNSDVLMLFMTVLENTLQQLGQEAQ
jgi:predicted  nucleic acid-binding Zn-ribbon protein